MLPKSNQKLPYLLERVRIDDFAAEGKCLSRIDGEVLFVEGFAAPGDLADVRVFKKKKNFREGQMVALHEPSNLRVTPECEHFGTCGGCKWQHVDYAAQLDFKARHVRDALERIGKIDLPPIQPILGAPEIYFYRNKLEFTFSSLRWLTDEEIKQTDEVNRNAAGFHVPRRFDRVLDIRRCHLQPDPSNAIRLALKNYADEQGLSFYDVVKQQGFLRLLTIRTSSTGQVMVVVQVAEPDELATAGVMDFLKSHFPEITSLHYALNQKGNDTMHDLDVICWAGTPYIEEEMEGLRFRIGPKSFYQTNSAQAYQLYRVARDFAQLSGDELVYDLYTGTGTIANFVARQVRKVVGLEYVPAAVEDAHVNSVVNGITNTAFFAGDMKKLLTPGFFSAQGHPDVVITDPPRAGMDLEVVLALLDAAPQRIVYVSCNPATQARDLALLDGQYAVTAVQPVDMFPHTHHVENVVGLVRR
ncbi:MAG: 23S rRNA (uracil(1939)-C(5))-methyltransferase RlmD [Cytophagaceae bacterium]|nr:23S rRNA (uracil(1939)-C(5))-methyltransferase RlmD [Cytophagaceae bacterium]